MHRIPGSWRREGGEQASCRTFDAGNRKPVLGNLRYMLESEEALGAIPGSIRLVYEELCDPAFTNARMDGFFEAHIALDSPQAEHGARSAWASFRIGPRQPGMELENEVLAGLRTAIFRIV
jgi:hypothetical protein